VLGFTQQIVHQGRDPTAVNAAMLGEVAEDDYRGIAFESKV
jgi:hypothetical protein